MSLLRLLIELYGPPGVGKTHAAHTIHESVLHIDTCTTQLSVQDHEVQQMGADDAHGESWPVVLDLYGYDEQTASEHYAYATSFEQIRAIVEADDNAHDVVVIDNTSDLRNLAIKDFLAESGQTWIAQEQYGAVNDMVDGITEEIKRQGYHVVWCTQLKDEYRNGQKTGEKVPESPKRADHRCDFRLRLAIEDNERAIHVEKNRHMDATSDEPGAAGTVLDDVSLDLLAAFSGIPEDRL